jgi:hypothetical protein
MPEIADVMAGELTRTLETHEIYTRLERASYGQEYTYTLPTAPGQTFDLAGAYDHVVGRVGTSFREVCRQATMYELMKPERSVNNRLSAGEAQLALADNDRILDVALHGADSVRREVMSEAQAIVNRSANSSAPAPVATAPAQEDDFVINILDEQPPVEDFDDIKIGAGDFADESDSVSFDLEESYADKLDNIGDKTRQVFQAIMDDLFSDDDLLPRLRRLFWLEATKAERDFNNHLIKPMMRQHDRKLYDESLRANMEMDLESVSDIEELMRVWEGLHELEVNAGI